MPQRPAGTPKHWLDFKAIKEAARFEPILERYGLELTQKGQELVGRCPFHEDTRPSFRVNLGKNVFHCFGCHAKGNVLDFVVRKEGVGIKRAAELLADWCDLRHSESSAERTLAAEGTPATIAAPSAPPTATDTQPAREEGSSGESAAEAMKPLTFTLKLDPEHPYLKERGLSPELIEHFGLGYCSKGMMRGRIAIPIHDGEGNLVAYAGRWVGKDPPEGEGKYKLPPKFEKSAVVFNLQRVQRWETKRTEEVILVEGYFSVFWLHQNGWPNVVAVMGSSLSERQRELIAERFDRVRILLDGDDAGREAAKKIAVDLGRQLFVKLLNCPHERQPDDLSPEELTTLLGDPART